MKKYKAYKDSGIDWIGDIPEQWVLTPLKYCVNCNEISLGEDTPENFLIEYIDIGSVTLEDGVVTTQAFFFKDSPSRARRIVKEGNVIVSTVRTYLKAIARIKIQQANLIASTGFAVLSAKNILNPGFLYYFCISNGFVNDVNSISKGVSYPSVTASDLLKLQICIPALHEQSQIGQYLDHKIAEIDKLITDKGRLIELLNDERTAVINQAVTKGLDLSVPMKNSGIEWYGEMPSHWHLKRMKYLCEIGTGDKDTENREADGAYPFYVRSDTIERISTYSFDGEAILTAGDGVGVCKVWHYVTGKFDYHQRVYRMSDFSEVLGRYLFYYLKENFEKEVKKLSAKSTVDSLRRPMFQNFLVAFGSKDEQLSIINFIEMEESRINSITEKIIDEIRLLTEYKTALISEAVTGKVDVRNEVIAESIITA